MKHALTEMSGYKKTIQAIIDRTYKPLGHNLIVKDDELRDDADIEDLDWNPDLDMLPDDEIAFTTGSGKESRRHGGPISAEEARLLRLLSDIDVPLKTQILNSKCTDIIKAKCLQMLREYEDDPENNSTTLTTIQLILKLPTTVVSSPVTFQNPCEETTEFLNNAWLHMQSQVYGQDRAKSEIIEYLVSKLLATDHSTPRVLGLVGQPGVGKTSLAIHGIARVMGVPFHQISVGGLRDVNYFSGSMRCWKGARQGVFSDILIKCGCLNPIIYIDELDKVASESSIDIYGLLTHAVDPITNSRIQDHYLGIDLDLSKVTFIFSYNNAHVLPEPLRDRIKEIYFDGFNNEEKVDIARDFIIPAQLKEYGVTDRDIHFTDDVIAYTNKSLNAPKSEISGVRYLNKGYQSLIGKIMVNVIANATSYNHLRRRLHGITPQDGGVRKRGRGQQKRKDTIKFVPYYKPVKLPYTPKHTDIDYYLQ